MTFHQGRHRKGVRCRLSGILYEETLQMRHASLFTGIGGFDLAAQWMGWENVFQVEIDKFCQKVLEKNFPNTKRYGDIKQFNGTEWAGKIDVLSGGFPCQPFSAAGKRKGKNDNRFLWPEMLRVCAEVRPGFIVAENVDGITSMEDGRTLERIFINLESIGYSVESFLIPAASVGAWHRRNRVWIVAHSNRSKSSKIRRNFGEVCSLQETERQSEHSTALPGGDFTKATSNIEHERRKEQRIASTFKSSPIVPNLRWGTESGMVRRVHGIPNRVDRIKSLGNAIVPQVAFEIFKAIEHVKNQNL